MSAAGPALALRGVDKRFGACWANRGVTLEVAAGSVHALVGENGAGKSTAMNLAYGLIAADAGEILIKGQPVDRARHTPREAIARGLGMVHQHFMLVETLTVVENVVLGAEHRRGPLLDLARGAAEIAALCERFGFQVDPRARVEDLSVGEQQRIELVKALWRGCDVLILDEPTAVLTPGEVGELFAVLRSLVAEGMTVVLITHKLDEVLAIADAITVMRRGEVVDTRPAAGASADDLARAMVGRPVAHGVRRAGGRPGDVMLRVENLAVAGRAGLAVDGVSLSVCAGEIVGIAGVAGNGQQELVEALAGLRRPVRGEIFVGETALTGGVASRLAAGVAHVPEDRHARGLVLDYTVADNLILGRQRCFCRGPGALLLDGRRIAAHAAAAIAAHDIRPTEPDTPARALSGGNQQKVVIARELGGPGDEQHGGPGDEQHDDQHGGPCDDTSAPRVLLAAQPTRGVDIGAIEAIHARLLAARDAGAAVLLSSAELSELHALCDRVLVMVRGTIVATLDAAALAADDVFDTLGALMTGARVVSA